MVLTWLYSWGIKTSGENEGDYINVNGAPEGINIFRLVHTHDKNWQRLTRCGRFGQVWLIVSESCVTNIYNSSFVFAIWGRFVRSRCQKVSQLADSALSVGCVTVGVLLFRSESLI